MTAVLTLMLVGVITTGSYDEVFTSEALRVDYYHGGVADQEDVALDRVVREPTWAGSRTQLLDPFEYGKYRVLLYDPEDGRLLYSRGYATLFGEWQTTEGAGAGSRRVFHESVRVPCPRRPVRLVLESRDRAWRFQPIFEQRLDPHAHTVERSRDHRAFEVSSLQERGDPAVKVDLLFLGEGYTRAQLPKLRRDARRYTEALFSWEPFASRRDDFNVRVIESVSAEPGVDEPRKGVFRDTLYSYTFNTFDTARYLNSLDNRTIRDVAAHAPYDALVIIVNTARYGGAGIYNFYSVHVADNEYDEYVAVHEFGHHFAALADEYFSSSVAYSEFYPRGVEPWEPNITASADPVGLKWAELLTAGVPTPTPADEPRWRDAVGAFEGAGYAAKGLFRPQRDCKMKSKAAVPFCAVCRRAVDAMIDAYVK